MNFEVIFDELEYKDPYNHFLKYAYKYNANSVSNEKIEYIKDIKELFPFVNLQDIERIKNKYKKTKVKEFSSEWFKNENKPKWQPIENNMFSMINRISGICTNNSFKKYIMELIPGSFGIQTKFKLQSPYYSKDDDEFYIIDNPIMKEKVWKVPMIRGSSWKGLFYKAARLRLNDFVEKKEIENIIDCFLSIARIFGMGSEEVRVIEEEVDEHFEQNGNKQAVIDKVIRYGLNELGVNLMLTKGEKSIAEQIWMQIKGSINVKKGRVVFYPTYFNRLSVEVINPHDRRTKAGTQPIYYEVVPKNTEGLLQILYIPYDAVTTPIKKMRKQIEDDFQFLQSLLKEMLGEIGIGAKSKLGWGRFEVESDPFVIWSDGK